MTTRRGQSTPKTGPPLSPQTPQSPPSHTQDDVSVSRGSPGRRGRGRKPRGGSNVTRIVVMWLRCPYCRAIRKQITTWTWTGNVKSTGLPTHLDCFDCERVSPAGAWTTVWFTNAPAGATPLFQHHGQVDKPTDPMVR